MAKPNALADNLDDWQSLLAAVHEDAAVLPTVEPHRVALEQAYNEVLATKARREMHKAGKQQATQDMRALVVKGKEKAVRLRGAVKADMGHRSERLVHYGMVPARKRLRQEKPAPEPPAPPPPKPEAPPATGPVAGPPVPGGDVK